MCRRACPFFFNDDVMIPALIVRRAWRLCGRLRTTRSIGCVETVIPGKANPHAVTGATATC